MSEMFISYIATYLVLATVIIFMQNLLGDM